MLTSRLKEIAPYIWKTPVCRKYLMIKISLLIWCLIDETHSSWWHHSKRISVNIPVACKRWWVAKAMYCLLLCSSFVFFGVWFLGWMCCPLLLKWCVSILWGLILVLNELVDSKPKESYANQWEKQQEKWRLMAQSYFLSPYSLQFLAVWVFVELCCSTSISGNILFLLYFYAWGKY